MTSLIKITAIASLFALATACSFTKEKTSSVDDSVEYKNARSIPALKIPTDVKK